ncbi:zinc finger protein 845-like [Malaya genurostris]|uniref:zinc finger protein 845-like n=1 Tax=Malaya genurostris TaxID=325434 RepID=UPI0026F3CA96|nr:zinc finger protein 845-like [Malaya genurostris]XP_058461598.1 zinc finger protein 845-like [Malaya genurostris]
MNNTREYVVYGYALGNQVFEIKPDAIHPNAPAFVPGIIQIIPAQTIAQSQPQNIRITEDIQICEPIQHIQVVPEDISSFVIKQPESSSLNSQPNIGQTSPGVVPTDPKNPSLDMVQVDPVGSKIVSNIDASDREPETFFIGKSTIAIARTKSKSKNVQISTLSSKTTDEVAITVKSLAFKSKKDFIYECDICDSQFLSPVSLRIHKTGHRYGAPEEKVSYVCRFCGRQFSHLQTLGDHEKMHIDDRYDCDTCRARYTSKSGLRNHLTKNEKCNVAYQMKKLQKKKQEEEQKEHGCDICGKTYRHRKSMLEHRSLHFRNKQHRCDLCGVMFETTGGWRKHRANKRCEFSKRKFKDSGGDDEVFIPEDRKKFLEEIKKLEEDDSAEISLGRKNNSKRIPRECRSSNSNGSSHCSDNDNDIGGNTSYEDDFEPAQQNDEFVEPSPEMVEIQAMPGISSETFDENEIELDSVNLLEEIKEEILSDQEVECKNNNAESDTASKTGNLSKSVSTKTPRTIPDTQRPTSRKSQEPKEHKCPTCGKTFARGFILKNHVRKHTGERPFLCDSCPKSFSDAASLKMHSVVHTGEKQFSCSECPARFARKSGLRNHITIHFNLPCDECDQKFSSRKTLVRHKIKHKGIRPFLCEICSKDFRTKADMTAHMRIHSNEKRYVCKICSARFNCPSTLRRHRNVHAPPETRPVCETCGKSFSSRQALQKHENIHKDLKPFQCEICSKCFRVKDHLKVHLRSHYGEKPFPCDLCPKRFVTNGDLRVHYRRHTGEKPYTCDECGLGFVVTAGLYRHQNETGHENSKASAIIVPEYTRAS